MTPRPFRVCRRPDFLTMSDTMKGTKSEQARQLMYGPRPPSIPVAAGLVRAVPAVR